MMTPRQKKYESTEKGKNKKKARSKKYKKSKKGKETQKRWSLTEKGKSAKKRATIKYLHKRYGWYKHLYPNETSQAEPCNKLNAPQGQRIAVASLKARIKSMLIISAKFRAKP